MKAALCPVILFATFMADQANAKSGYGDDLLESCSVSIKGNDRNLVEAGQSMYCLGVVTTVLQLETNLTGDDQFCRPKGVTTGQAVRVIVKFLNANPEKLHLWGANLAIAAMKSAWPCPK